MSHDFPSHLYLDIMIHTTMKANPAGSTHGFGSPRPNPQPLKNEHMVQTQLTPPNKKQKIKKQKLQKKTPNINKNTQKDITTRRVKSSTSILKPSTASVTWSCIKSCIIGSISNFLLDGIQLMSPYCYLYS